MRFGMICCYCTRAYYSVLTCGESHPGQISQTKLSISASSLHDSWFCMFIGLTAGRNVISLLLFKAYRNIKEASEQINISQKSVLLDDNIFSADIREENESFKGSLVPCSQFCLQSGFH